MERQFRLEEVHVFADQRAIACTSISTHNNPVLPQRDATPRIPRMPSPPTPRIKLSIQLTCCCASRTTIGWPSCRTLWMVISALYVWTSSASTGWLYSSQGERVSLETGATGEGGGTPHTPSYPPRRRPMTCGPRYRRYSSGHVFLDTIFNNRSSNALFKARDCGVLYHIRFGAVSSIEVNYCQLPHSYSPPHIFNSIVKLKKHTNTSGLANINRQIGLRPTTFKPSS